MPAHPVLTRDQPLQGDEGLPQQRVLPEGAVSQDPKVDHPLVQVPPWDPLVHQHLVVGGVACASRRLRLPLAHLLRVGEEIEFHVGVGVSPILQRLQSSDVYDHDEEFFVLVGDGQFDLAELFS